MCLNKYKCLHCAQPAPPPPAHLADPLAVSATLAVALAPHGKHGYTRDICMHFGPSRPLTCQHACNAAVHHGSALQGTFSLRRGVKHAPRLYRGHRPFTKIALGGCDPKHTFTSNIIVVVPCCLSFVCGFLILLGILRNIEDSSESVCAIHCCCGE